MIYINSHQIEAAIPTIGTIVNTFPNQTIFAHNLRISSSSAAQRLRFAGIRLLRDDSMPVEPHCERSKFEQIWPELVITATHDRLFVRVAMRRRTHVHDHTAAMIDVGLQNNWGERAKRLLVEPAKPAAPIITNTELAVIVRTVYEANTLPHQFTGVIDVEQIATLETQYPGIAIVPDGNKKNQWLII